MAELIYQSNKNVKAVIEWDPTLDENMCTTIRTCNRLLKMKYKSKTEEKLDIKYDKFRLKTLAPYYDRLHGHLSHLQFSVERKDKLVMNKQMYNTFLK